MAHIRKWAVAGRFYPAAAKELQATVKKYLDRVSPEPGKPPRALIVPHAGFEYSGPIAATAYARLASLRESVDRVLLIGPAHYVAVSGLAAPSYDAFATPLGTIPVDTSAIRGLLDLRQVTLNDGAHDPEHCLEVELPFLQTVLGDFELIPLLVGDATAEQVAEVIDRFWDDPHTFIVISSDLSHFHDYETATVMDAATSSAIEHLEADKLTAKRACGFRGIQGLLKVAILRGGESRILDVRNSGDTAGMRDRVVGYGAYAVE